MMNQTAKPFGVLVNAAFRIVDIIANMMVFSHPLCSNNTTSLFKHNEINLHWCDNVPGLQKPPLRVLLGNLGDTQFCEDDINSESTLMYPPEFLAILQDSFMS